MAATAMTARAREQNARAHSNLQPCGDSLPIQGSLVSFCTAIQRGCSSSGDPMPRSPEIIKVEHLPPQNDTYSQAVRLGDVIYISGQLGVRRDGTLPESFQAQVRQALENVRTVLRAAG